MRYKCGWAVLFAIILILLLAAPALAQKTLEEIVARVNADIILKSELENAKNSLRQELGQQGLQGAQLEQAIAERSKNLLRDLIDQALLLQQAKEMGVNSDLELVKTMERMRVEYKFDTSEALEKAIVEQGMNLDEFKQNIRSRYLSGQVLSREVYGKIVITTEELRTYYDEHKKDFERPAGVQVREIVLNTENKSTPEIEAQRKKAEEALAALKKGDDFTELARKYSESQTAQDGGQLGFFEKGQLAKPLEDAASKLEKGQYTDILTLPYGFVIIKVDDKHSGGILPFEIAHEEIQRVLYDKRVQPKIREYLTKLRSDGFIEVRDGYVDTGAAPKTAKAIEAKPGKN